jgi:LL-diaminopimelate aminotransferase
MNAAPETQNASSSSKASHIANNSISEPAPKQMGDETNSSAKKIAPANRLANLSVYIFAELARLKKDLDPNWLIDLSLGSPDSSTPKPILDDLSQKLLEVKNHGYPPFEGKISLRQGICEWFKTRFGVQLNEKQVLPLIGSKEGLAHLPLAYINPGDVTLIPNPHYPVHARGTIIASGIPHYMPLKESNDFLPDFGSIAQSTANKAKMMILSYPNNPTGAIANPDFMKASVEFARKNNILYCNDLAYSELGFYGHKPQSIFEYMSLDEPGIEFFTFSKTYHMAGWRIGFCVGNEEVVQTLYALKSNMDYGVSGSIQDIALKALSMPDSYYSELKSLYQERAEICLNILKENLGWQIFKPKGAMYLWLAAPKQYDGNGAAFSADLLTKAGVVTTPGIAFGSEGQSHVRIALVQPKEKIAEAMNRICSQFNKL